MTNKYDSLVDRFLLAEPIHRIAARMILIALQEDAIEPLADAYFAGVNDEQGAAIIDLMAEIGGYEALNILRDIVKHETKRRKLRLAAAEGLLRNADNLSKKELNTIERFVAKYGSSTSDTQ
ncbi:MAG: hypothetical protein WBC91_08750 [Phototrophicaceae bacterium]